MLEGDLGVDELLLKIPTCWLERDKLLENGLRFLPVLRGKRRGGFRGERVPVGTLGKRAGQAE
jgi:hypothetical protein